MTCDTAGVIGPVVQQVAAYQVTDALKLLTGHDTPSGMLRSFDIWTNERLKVRSTTRFKDETCPTCGLRQFPFLSSDKEAKAAVLMRHDNTVQIRPAAESRRSYEWLSAN